MNLTANPHCIYCEVLQQKVVGYVRIITITLDL